MNLNVTVDAVDQATYQPRLKAHDFDAALVEYSLGGSADPDVYDFWHEGQYPDGKNYGGVSDRRISELLEKARQDPFGINRVQDYQQFQRDFVDARDCPAALLSAVHLRHYAAGAGRAVGLHRLARRPLPQHRRLVDQRIVRSTE